MKLTVSGHVYLRSFFPTGAKRSHHASFSLPSSLALVLKYWRNMGNDSCIAASMVFKVSRSMREVSSDACRASVRPLCLSTVMVLPLTPFRAAANGSRTVSQAASSAW